MSTTSFPESNLTYQILSRAREGGYAVGAFNIYSALNLQAIIQAAETNNSPAIIQLFPWSLHFHGPHFISYAVSVAHAASVPIAIHLDHCTLPSDAELALSLPVTFDSIMVDGDMEYVKKIVKKAEKRGITVEAELDRIAGGEEGLPPPAPDKVEDGKMTDPMEAAEFVKNTGVHFLAPGFGNVHGGYPIGGPERCWNLERLREIGNLLPEGVEMVLHGTTPAGDELIKDVIRTGVRKINMNGMVRKGYVDAMRENVGASEMKWQQEAVRAYAEDVGRVMREVLGSAGKA
ncbi:fructose-bisphosphate aldolase [Pyronema omphalodes]|nr:fructose-bisphosphate aldolase [Pyronema omphalodes]